MRILLVYPEVPDTFWGFQHALRFLGKKALQPPLGLLTVAAMLPEEWEKRLIDMNVSRLGTEDLRWADMVFLSSMEIQRKSAVNVIHRCRKSGTPIVAGGPMFTADPESFDQVDHLVLNEAELTLPRFLEDLSAGRPEHVYRAEGFADLSVTPIPEWNLIKASKYFMMNIQYSRGCPYECDFCDITALFGRRCRTKSPAQVTAELEALYRGGWRGDVFFVDDNFIGNRTKLKRHVLPAITDWSKERSRPFEFQTEASINLADDEELMSMMVDAGFGSVFVGIETTNDEALAECGKFQNRNRDLLSSVKKIQSAGLQVTAGFILGFDNDTPTIFTRITQFIQQSGIVTAMVGLLNAPRNTRLYKRLMSEKRILGSVTGNNVDLSLNFVPRMDRNTLIEGYKNVIRGIYSAGPYYERVVQFLKEFSPLQNKGGHFGPRHLWALVKSFFLLGLYDKERKYYWKLVFWTLFRRPRFFPMAVTFAIYGHHFRRYFADML